MKYAGLVLLAMATGIFLHDATSRLSKRREDYESLCRLLECMRREIEEFSRSASEILSAFSQKDENVAELAAYLLTRKRGERREGLLLIDADDAEAVYLYFDKLGTSYKNEELLRLNTLISAVQKKRDEAIAASGKKIKAIYLLYVTALIGALIFIM